MHDGITHRGMSKKNRFIQYTKKLDSFIPWWLAAALLVLVFLRIPTFFEPYWYGDEGIYLTIGNALNNGAKLYADIVDHKTPLIYYLARVPDQFSFRILLTFWMLATTVAFAKLSQFFFKSTLARALGTGLFVLFTTLPWFEGTIPNGELFVMGFTLVGLLILTWTPTIRQFFSHTTQTAQRQDAIWLLLSGVLFGCAVLTKVPAVFDLAAVTGLFLLIFVNQKKPTATGFGQISKVGMLFLIGFIIPILLSVVYFVAIGAGQDYLNFGLLYNFHYTGTWVLHFSNQLLAFLYTMTGKALVVFAGVISVVALRSQIPRVVQFLTIWTFLALFASLLSNRPYPHYFLQVIPSLILLVCSLFEWQHYKKMTEKITTIAYSATALILFVGVLVTLNVGLYPVIKYYQNFWQLVSQQQTAAQYRNSFNYLMADNYAALSYLRGSHDKKMFIWGTNPTLYALTKKQPVGKFTVSFHIKDLGLYEETMQAVAAYKPEFIVVMHNETTPLPGLDQFIRNNYIPFEAHVNFTVWRKSLLSAL